MKTSETTGALLCPEKIVAERWIAFGTFAAACAYLCLFRRYTSMDPDEGIILQGAQRILQGEVPYRDFFSFFTPGSYYLLALVFKVFGNTFAVAHTVLVIYGGVFTLFVYWMARRVCSRWTALMTAYLTLATCLPWRFMTLHNWDSTLWLCLTVYSAIVCVQAPRAGWAVALGTFASLTFLFEQSKGAGLILGLILGYGALTFVRPGPAFLTKRNGLALAVGFAWPIGLTLAYFARQHALGAMFADWAWPLRHYSVVNKVPYGYADWSDQIRQDLFRSGSWVEDAVAIGTVSPYFVLPALPIIAVLLLVYWMVASKSGGLAHDRAPYYLIVGSSIAGTLLSVIAVRANITHFVYLAPLLYLVLAWLMDGSDIPLRIVHTLRPAIVAVVFVTFTAIGMASLVSVRNAQTIVRSRRGVMRTAGSEELVPFVEAHVPQGTKIFIYPYFPLGYYVTATANATRYEYLQPGMHTRAQAEEAIRALAANQTDVVLFEPGFYEKIYTSWPNTPVEAIADDLVAGYILRSYHACASLISGGKARFSFMMRDGLPCPAMPSGHDAALMRPLAAASRSHNEKATVP